MPEWHVAPWLGHLAYVNLVVATNAVVMLMLGVGITAVAALLLVPLVLIIMQAVPLTSIGSIQKFILLLYL